MLFEGQGLDETNRRVSALITKVILFLIVFQRASKQSKKTKQKEYIYGVKIHIKKLTGKGNSILESSRQALGRVDISVCMWRLEHWRFQRSSQWQPQLLPPECVDGGQQREAENLKLSSEGSVGAAWLEPERTLLSSQGKKKLFFTGGRPGTGGPGTEAGFSRGLPQIG